MKRLQWFHSDKTKQSVTKDLAQNSEIPLCCKLCLTLAYVYEDGTVPVLLLQYAWTLSGL